MSKRKRIHLGSLKDTLFPDECIPTFPLSQCFSTPTVTTVSQSSYVIQRWVGNIRTYRCDNCSRIFQVPVDADMYRVCPYCALSITYVHTIDNPICEV